MPYRTMLIAPTLADLKAAPTTEISILYDAAPFTWIIGNFSGKGDDLNVVEADGVPLSNGAWLRQSGSKITFRQDGTNAIIRDTQAKSGEIVSVKDFGAIGDGIANDTEALQAAIDECILSRRGLLIPSGTYMVEGLVAVLNDGPFESTFQIKGEGRRASRLRKVDNSIKPILTIIENYSDPSPSQIDVTDMEITGNGKCAGLLLNKCSGFSVRRVMFNTCTRAIDLSGSLIGEISDCDLNGSGTGIRLAKDGFVSGANHITVRNCRIKGNGVGVDAVRGSRISVVECDLEQNGTAGDQATGAIKVRSGYGADISFSIINFTDCWMEANRGWTIDIEDQADTTVFIAIDRCKIIDNDATDIGNKRAIRCSGSGQYLAIRDTFSGSPGDLWDLSASKRIIENCVTHKVSGNGQFPDIFNHFLIGSNPIEGNRQSDLHLGAGRKIRVSWAGGAGFYEFGGNGYTGDLDLTGNGAFRVNAASLKANFSEYQIGGQKVLGARGAAISNASDAASAISQLNSLLSQLRLHGLIAS